VLQRLADEGHELPRLILEHRSLAKLKSTYTDKSRRWSTGSRAGAHLLSPGGAATGRLSSSDPNLQNIPSAARRAPDPPGLRPRARWRMVAADYSQIELRIMATSPGRGAARRLRRREDIHRATASEVFGVPLGEVTATSAAPPRPSTSG